MASGTVAIIGGTGKLGSALARRWIKAGLAVSIGSRDAERARDTATALADELGVSVDSGANEEVAAQADVIVLTVPFASQEAIVTSIREAVSDQLVIDTTVPLVPPKVMRVQLPEPGCAALRTQRILGDSANVCSAFQTVAAHKLARDVDMQSDVLVFGDVKEQRERVAELVRAAGLRPVHGGPLQNSAAAEAMTSVLIFVNRHYGSDGAGIMISGIDSETGVQPGS
jgi:NADPH-dependent F420 reductase